jgi:hypothetical protein
LNEEEETRIARLSKLPSPIPPEGKHSHLCQPLGRMQRNEAKVEVRIVRGLRPRPLKPLELRKEAADIGLDQRARTLPEYVTSGRTQVNAKERRMVLANMLILWIKGVLVVVAIVRRVGEVEVTARVEEKEVEALRLPAIRRRATLSVRSTSRVLATEVAIVDSFTRTKMRLPRPPRSRTNPARTNLSPVLLTKRSLRRILPRVGSQPSGHYQCVCIVTLWDYS